MSDIAVHIRAFFALLSVASVLAFLIMANWPIRDK